MSRKRSERNDDALRTLSESALDVNREGHLTIEGWDTTQLAHKYGTPLWIVSETTLRGNYKRIKRAFGDTYPSLSIAYATKANHAPAITRIMLQEGARIDFVSIGQYYLARMAGAAPERLVFNGNNKTQLELETAVREGVGLINVDSMDELLWLGKICSRLKKRAKICIRVRPGYSKLQEKDPQFVSANTHNNKFGIDIPSGQALDACRLAIGMKYVDFVGLHHHVGWTAYGIPYDKRQDLERLKTEVEEVVDFANEVEDRIGFRVSILDLGGGFRKPRPHFFGPDKVRSIPKIDDYAHTVTSTIKKELAHDHGRLPELILEPGGYIVTDAVTLLSTVGNIKSVNKGSGKGKWVSVDASAYMFARKLIFNFFHQTLIANKLLEPPSETVDIVGNTCAYDYICDKVRVPRLERGDIIATLDQGSYCETISTQYCAIPRPAVLLANKNETSIIKRRETPEDIKSLYEIPDWLNSLSGSETALPALATGHQKSLGVVQLSNGYWPLF